MESIVDTPTETTDINQRHAPTEQRFRKAIIDLDAIRHNVKHLKTLAGTEEFIAVVKANGYGHGALQVANAAIKGGATRIGVADLQEALDLKLAGLDQVPLLAWLHPPGTTFHEAAQSGIEIGIWSTEQLEAAAAASSSATPARVHIKVETGLGRGGAAPQDWLSLFTIARQFEAQGRISIIGIFSHLSGASAEEDLKQLDVFNQAIATATETGISAPLQHLAATAATISLPPTRLNTVRVGVGIYGLSPFSNYTSADLNLRPAMTLQAPIAATRKVSAGHGVSYGYDYRTSEGTTLALIPLGYADGIPRQASGKTTVLINGEKYPAVGRIAMDQFIVEVGQADVKTGDLATVFGDPAEGAAPADAWAEAAGTINYELVTRIGFRVQRVYQGLDRT